MNEQEVTGSIKYAILKIKIKYAILKLDLNN